MTVVSRGGGGLVGVSVGVSVGTAVASLWHPSGRLSGSAVESFGNLRQGAHEKDF